MWRRANALRFVEPCREPRLSASKMHDIVPDERGAGRGRDQVRAARAPGAYSSRLTRRPIFAPDFWRLALLRVDLREGLVCCESSRVTAARLVRRRVLRAAVEPGPENSQAASTFSLARPTRRPTRLPALAASHVVCAMGAARALVRRAAAGSQVLCARGRDPTRSSPAPTRLGKLRPRRPRALRRRCDQRPSRRV
jgi:hypothetical protein